MWDEILDLLQRVTCTSKFLHSHLCSSPLPPFPQVPIVAVLKAMGVQSDQEVVQMVGRKATFMDMLAPSIQECAALDIFTQAQALDYLGTKVSQNIRSLQNQVPMCHVSPQTGIYPGEDG